MEKKQQQAKEQCELKEDEKRHYRNLLPEITEQIIDTCNTSSCYTHINNEPIPSDQSVIDIVTTLRKVLFPGYFHGEKLDPVNFRYHMGQTVNRLYDMLAEQITRSIRHDCLRYDRICELCIEKGQKLAIDFMEQIPSVRNVLATDIKAAYAGDPAAKSYDEIIFSYPGIFAIMVYRTAHLLYDMDVPLLPRIMSEYAHGKTGIDIHPGAIIGEQFVIDHGTGVVVGETTTIGKNVRIYQGVTLGALSLPKDAGETLKGKKRHPTIEDDVIIYSGATILGGETIIGKGSVIGGNVWITQSVPPGTRVIMEMPPLIYK